MQPLRCALGLKIFQRGWIGTCSADSNACRAAGQRQRIMQDRVRQMRQRFACQSARLVQCHKKTCVEGVAGTDRISNPYGQGGHPHNAPGVRGLSTFSATGQQNEGGSRSLQSRDRMRSG